MSYGGVFEFAFSYSVEAEDPRYLGYDRDDDEP